MFVDPRKREVQPLVADLLLVTHGFDVREAFDQPQGWRVTAGTCEVQQGRRGMLEFRDLFDGKVDTRNWVEEFVRQSEVNVAPTQAGPTSNKFMRYAQPNYVHRVT